MGSSLKKICKEDYVIYNNSFLFLLFLTLTINIGFGLIIPVMPILLKEHGFSTGYMSSAFLCLVFARFLFQNIGGSLIPKIGTQRILLFSFVFYSILMFYYPFIDSRNLFLLFRFAEGCFEGLAVVCLHYLSIELSTKEDRGKKMGQFSATFGLGFIIGPTLGGIMYEYYGSKGMFWSAMILGIIGILGLIFYGNRLGIRRRNNESKSVFPKLNKDYLRFFPFYGPYFLRRILFFSFIIILPLFVSDYFAISSSRIGLIFTMSAIITTLLMPFSGKVSDKISPYFVVMISLLIMSGLIAFFGFVTDQSIFLILFLLETLAFCFMLPAAMKIFGNLVEKHPKRGSIMGLFGSLTDISTMIIPFILLPLYNYKATLPWLFLSSICFIISVPYIKHIGFFYIRKNDFKK